jgi:hypothetical protein
LTIHVVELYGVVTPRLSLGPPGAP